MKCLYFRGAIWGGPETQQINAQDKFRHSQNERSGAAGSNSCESAQSVNGKDGEAPKMLEELKSAEEIKMVVAKWA